MSTSQPWTIDGIGHALPHPELRATFMREVSFTDVRELPAVLERWVAFIQTFEAERPRLEQLRELVHENGHPPATYTAGLIDVAPDELHSAADENRRGAA
ncbi:hypothetical protein BLA24_04730 [Streptomyces cinnamoneus]|uniref:Uncharacterized protein n=1 Tax=Streptomyces cinnamoneus TaxID=53446 RepID=A0A2G1XNQ0_STRCJ|nr:hypothetical protein [Streptomyces cinnamoneus]PHQ52874.1 hypothetical protein BLA24_04730 [Streptomyces cinnamoneus]PPT11467.1 hypothetical protein CYQ11_28805 [Streptomyces cinnamoneus]